MSMEKDYFGNIWVKSYLENKRDYPIGTKFKNIFGSYWVLTDHGFEWTNGSTFPNIGGDWSGEVCLPEKINQFDINKAEIELKNCPKIIKDYVALLKKDNVKTKELL